MAAVRTADLVGVVDPEAAALAALEREAAHPAEAGAAVVPAVVPAAVPAEAQPAVQGNSRVEVPAAVRAARVEAVRLADLVGVVPPEVAHRVAPEQVEAPAAVGPEALEDRVAALRRAVAAARLDLVAGAPAAAGRQAEVLAAVRARAGPAEARREVAEPGARDREERALLVLEVERVREAREAPQEPLSRKKLSEVESSNPSDSVPACGELLRPSA